MARISTHSTATICTNKFRTIIDATEAAIYKELTDRDYGVDGIVELFDCVTKEVTGQIAYIQIKGKEIKANIRFNKKYK